MPSPFSIVSATAAVLLVLATGFPLQAIDESKTKPFINARQAIGNVGVKPDDCPQFGVSSLRNNVSAAWNIPTHWNLEAGINIKWSAELGSQTWGSPVVANGKIFIGTSKARSTDGRLLCIEEETGKVLWQHSTEALAFVRKHDCIFPGVCSTPCVEGNRVWYVTNRYEIVCLDAEGFRDGENDGPATDEPNQNHDEADVIWRYDMIGKLGAVPRHASCCSVTVFGETLFVGTWNGTDHHRKFFNAEAPSFLALDRKTGAILWTDFSPGENILNGQWSSPACGVLGGVAQVVFAGGDGWLYSFAPRGDNGRSKLLWKFDCNPKTSEYRLERSSRNPILAVPVIYDGLVYAGVGEDPEHGDGSGHLWCIDPTKRGDVSPTLVFNKRDPTTPVPPRRLIACDLQAGDFERENDNSAEVWHYASENPLLFEKTMHRTLGSVAIKNDLLFIADESGLLHCLDAKTGAAYWTHDLLAYCWSTPLIAGDCVYIADGDGKIRVFKVAKEMQLVSEQEMGDAIFTTPVVANGVLYIATRYRLFAIANAK
jgi:outer membrane protein assembly factor BamB